MKKTIPLGSRKAGALVLVLALGLATLSLAAEDTWTFKNPIPTGRGFVSGAVVDGKIYVIGGFPSHYSVTAANEMYDPATDQWTVMEPMPQARCVHATCAYHGKIYVFGGVSPSPYGNANKNVYEYDPQTNIWTKKADMPYANAFCGIAVVNGTIYLIGGNLNYHSIPFSRLMAYDPLTETWSEKAPMPTARGWLSACVVDGKIYAIGGASEDYHAGSYKIVEVYNPATNTWTQKADMPTGRAGSGICAMDGKIYVVGGYRHPATLSENLMYDPVTDTWSKKSSLQTRRHTCFSGLVKDKIYAIAGSYPVGSEPMILTSVEEYDTGLTVASSDFNGDGVVDLDDLVILIEFWGTDEPLCDIAPPPDGDGIVDVLDLELFIDYWEQEILPPEPPEPEPIAYLKLDETEGTTVTDSVGGVQADLYGDPQWRPAGGMVNGALLLDGIDDFVGTWGISGLSGAFELSVFAWVKGGAPGQVVVSQSRGLNWLMADANQGYLRTDLKEAGDTAQSLVSEVTITDGQWHRVGITWDGCTKHMHKPTDTPEKLNYDNIARIVHGLYLFLSK
jgi:hypothetical protein